MQNQTKYLFILITQTSRHPSEGAAQSRTLTTSLLNKTWQNLSPDAVRLLSFVEVNGRGYTAHEMLPQFGLINMNGRLYDPVLGRMLSPDNYIQAPDYTQNFNRYSYVYNNPLKYTDPDGEFVFAMIFLANVISDATDGGSFSLTGDFKHTGYILNQVNDASQITVYENNNVKITAGYDVYSGGMSANFNFQSGNFSGNFSAGIGISGWYVNGGISYSPGDLNISTGGGIGSNYKAWGANVTYKGWGLGYHKTYYGNEIGPDGKSNKQIVGGVDVYFNYNSLTLENDFLGDKHDRWRSNAIEYRGQNGLIVGTHLYNNDPEGEDQKIDIQGISRRGHRNPPVKISKHRWAFKYGAWKNGKVYSSPLYIGYKFGNSIQRIGYSTPWVQEYTQNWVHENGFFYLPFGRQNFYTDDSEFKYGLYSYSGYYNPYSIWGH